MKDSKFLNQRSDKFTIVLNDNGLDCFKNSRNIVRCLRCCDYLSIIYIACIKHDKDLDESTNHVKTPHYHLVILFDRVYRIGSIINLLSDLFSCNANQITIDKCNSLVMQSRYLIHLDDYDKFQYDSVHVVTNDDKFLNNCFNYIKSINSIDDLIVIVQQFPKLTELMTRIGYENYKKYRIVIQDIRRELNFARY